MSDTAKHKIIFFDGVCNLCNASVRRIIKYDKTGELLFSSIQSDFAKHTLFKDEEPDETPKFLIYLRHNARLIKSDAALCILKDMRFGASFLYHLIIIPRPIRDFFYVLIAKHRYRLFGKKDRCMVPSPAVRKRFLE